MHCAPLWNVNSTKILTRRELATVLAVLKQKADRQANVRRNLVIVRLACCCGLHVSEIGGLQIDDVVLDVARPHMRLRRETTKGKKARCVSLWWNAGTLTELGEWKAERIRQGARGDDPFVCSVLANRRGLAIQRAAMRRRFMSACYALGRARVRTLTIHHGRHKFISHALADGRTLAEERATAGHSNVAITSEYLHVVVDEEERVGELFRCG